jgi:putative photosynthetic complex assembly protein
MSSTDTHSNMLPRGTLVLAGALVAFAFTSTVIVRVAGIPAAASPAAMRAEAKIAPVASRDLRFLDRADGAVVIEDVHSGQPASVIPPGQKTGFIRGVMRGLARERRSRGIGDQPPFNLTLFRDGELSLTDSATGRQIELTAFGSTNRAAFAALLPGQSISGQAASGQAVAGRTALTVPAT